MKLSMLLVVCAVVSGPQEDAATKLAIASVLKHEGKVEIDRDRPDQPVVAVDI